ncbi:hypothetical protein [Staphylococcus xylosus]|uniref:hypothetical protein n=1 Tax=Staphylococcus xylosus TaxID=1288 RepID=UPI002DBFDBAA|nr:hypothetical protein [Staphylococcus xylosus]MEB8101033.1 hypothetical protein [Staphylococcus xylosus]
MSEPTKEELLAFMRKHEPEKVDSITDTESAIRHFRCTSKVYKEQRDQYKAERDTLIDDIKELRKLNEGLKISDSCNWHSSREFERERDALEHENKALRLQAETYFDEWQNEKLTSQGLRDQCKEYAQEASKYTTLTDHIRLKAENNPGVSRYIDLVNYIDRLERD